MSNSKFNLIFMRDNSPVRRYRVSPALIKFGAYGLALLVLMACGGAAAGYTFWRENFTLRQEKGALERQLRESTMDLERLQNVDKILKSNDPEELQALLGSMSPPAERKAKKDERPAPAMDLKKLFDRVDTRQAGVENFQAKVNGEHMSVSFNLNNLLGAEMLTGTAQMSLVMVDGNQSPVDAKDADLSYQIQRFKQISTSFTLSKEMAQERIFGVRLTLKNPQGQTIFSETYPLSRS